MEAKVIGSKPTRCVCNLPTKKKKKKFVAMIQPHYEQLKEQTLRYKLSFSCLIYLPRQHQKLSNHNNKN
jgi:erythromycin esterase-like protein